MRAVSGYVPLRRGGLAVLPPPTEAGGDLIIIPSLGSTHSTAIRKVAGASQAIEDFYSTAIREVAAR